MYTVDHSIKYKKIIIAISALVFMFSLTQTAYTAGYGQDREALGFMVLVLGWLDWNGPGVSWFANPLLFLAWIMLFKKLKLSVFAALSAVIFSLSFLCFDKIVVDESGQYAKITTYGTGYWLWLSSCIITFLGALFLYLHPKTDKG